MRRIDEIIIHCTDTTPHWMQAQSLLAKRGEIDRWHREQKGWRGFGYHWLIDRNGSRVAGRPEQEEGAHVAGRNDHSIGVCLVGGRGSAPNDDPRDHFTEAQLAALRELIAELLGRYPHASLSGHNDHDAGKACPGFRVADQLAWLLPEAHRPLIPRIEDVAALQAALAEMGFAPGPIDGLWGPRTLGGARAFLFAHRITQIRAAPKSALYAAVQAAQSAARNAAAA